MLESKPYDIRIVNVTVTDGSVRFDFHLYFEGSRYPREPESREVIQAFVELPSHGLRVSNIESLSRTALTQAGQHLAGQGISVSP